MGQLRYAGTDRRGVHRQGCSEESAASLCERFFRDGWRRLVIRDEDGSTIGEIRTLQHRTFDPSDVRRTWWAQR